MKLVISPIENTLFSSVEVTLSVFLRIVATIAPRIFRPTIDMSQLKCTLNRAEIKVAPSRDPAYT